MMKKFILFLLPAMMLVACSNNKNSNGASDGNNASSDSLPTTVPEQKVVTSGPDDQSQTVEATVNEIYSKVGDDSNMNDLIDKYGSVSFKGALEREKAVEAKGMVGTIDYDIFLQAQEMDDFSAIVKSVKMTAPDMADVQVEIHNCGNVSNVRVVMKKEGDRWTLDNIYDKVGNVKKIMMAN